jgi:hypothetical protein
MSFLNKLVKTGLDIGTLPINLTADIITMGGVCTERKEPYTKSALKNIAEDFEEMKDELD